MTQARLLEALDSLPEGLVILDRDGRYLAWNRKYLEMYPNTADLIQVGSTLEEAVRRGIERGEYPEAAGCEEQWLAERLNRLRNPGPRYEQRLADGRCMLIEDRPMRDGGLVSLRVDISELKQREASFRLLFEGNPLPMFVCRREGWMIAAANEAAVAHYGFSRDELSLMSFAAIHCAVDPHAIPAGPTEDVEAALAARSFRHVRRDGALIEVEIKASSLTYDNEPSILVAIIDVTERRRSEHRMQHLARHDVLTGLLNRFALNESMRDLQRDVASGRSAAVLVLDLNKFKDVNDTLGHQAGDALLKEVARRLRRCVRDGDTVGRLGGEEYGILLRGGCRRADAADIAERILDAMMAPVDLNGRVVHIGASIGIAMMPQHSVLPDEIFRCADVAMYEAKHDRRNGYRFFEPEMDETLRRRTSIERDLARAIANEQLEVHYQPLVALDTGEVTCMEALVRWHHPLRGAVPPSAFIPIAEETGLIVDLGAFVLRRACSDASAWRSGVKVAVNVSALELDQPDFIARLRKSLDGSGLAADRLQIEVTESAVMSNVERATDVLTAIRELGVGVAMDDFGTGYSSLSYLHLYPVDRIKIDRSFVHNLGNPEVEKLVRAMIQLAQTLDLAVTAEGVETAEQHAALVSAGCNQLQGYFLGRPGEPEDIDALAKSRRKASAAA